MNLFEEETRHTPSRTKIPLAERVRPQKLSEFVGQEHLLGEGKALRAQIVSGQLVSMIFWGPPGSGKTTLARIIAKETKSKFVSLSAVDSGVAEVRKVIQDAQALFKQTRERLLLFIDEIHRFNKSQQDALLHSVEEGTLILIGATTENPSFEVINALQSRCKIYRLEELTPEHLNRIIDHALANDADLKQTTISIDDRETLLFYAGGDARNVLNTLELAVQLAKPDEQGIIHLTKPIFEEAYQRRNILYDRAGEFHYDTISAFIKSVRGSDPDAALYWMARMLEGGEDPKFIARRMIILASEDIGNADPYALTLAVSTFTGVDYIGMPESALILAQCAAYLASCPKSNASTVGIGAATNDVQNEKLFPVPLHLRNAATKLMSQMDYGKGYKYAHDFTDSGENNFAEQDYLPQELKDRIYYEPTENGTEKKFKERLERLWKKRRKIK
ncbi:replication-associated recombination protein A [bacterium]|nr:replication-associated recombination protein A [bacterium]